MGIRSAVQGNICYCLEYEVLFVGNCLSKHC